MRNQHNTFCISNSFLFIYIHVYVHLYNGGDLCSTLGGDNFEADGRSLRDRAAVLGVSAGGGRPLPPGGITTGKISELELSVNAFSSIKLAYL